jgi:hypothetical protein
VASVKLTKKNYALVAGSGIGTGGFIINQLTNTKMDFSILTASDFFGVLFAFLLLVFITYSIFYGLRTFKLPFQTKD